MTDAFDLLVIGGGQAGRRAALAAREVNPALRIAILGEEVHPPYDRPPLSKEVLHDPENVRLCEKTSADDYRAQRIELLPGDPATQIDRAARVVTTAAGRRYGYRTLILATGSRVRRLALPAELDDDVFYLRTRDDAARLYPRLTAGARVVVLGGGFIGLEVAAAARARGAHVVLVDQAERLLSRVFPPRASDRVLALHRAAGIDVRLGVRVGRVARGARSPVALTLERGDPPAAAETLEADLVVVGIGVIPNLELARDAGLATDDGILVDAYGRTSDPQILAAGEVTRHPVPGHDRPLRIEAWQVAELQAAAAGATAAGTPRRYDALPWFWSDQLGTNIQMLGLIPDDPHWVVRGNPDGAHTLFAFDRDGRVTGAIAFDSGRDISALRRVLAKGIRLDPAALADTRRGWPELMAGAA